MWDHVCTAERVRGGRCTRRSTAAYLCFGFRSERYDSPTWVEVCGHHAIDIYGQVTGVKIHKR
jgi:hypothetical protein